MDPVIVGECRMHRFLLFSFGILFLLPKVTLKQYWIYSVSPQCFLLPQLQIMCCYIARYYVKKARVPGGRKNNTPLSLGGGGVGVGQYRIDPDF